MSNKTNDFFSFQFLCVGTLKKIASEGVNISWSDNLIGHHEVHECVSFLKNDQRIHCSEHFEKSM